MTTHTGPMRCLSIRQPFAWAVCAGVKTVENRSRGTNYRGQIAIHASTSQNVVKNLAKSRGLRVVPGLFPFGAIIGVADLVDVEEMNESLEADPHAVGPVCWRLTNTRLLPSAIPSKGKLNLYSLTDEQSDEVRAQLTGLGPHELTPLNHEWAAALVNEYETWVNRSVAYDKLDRPDDWVRCLDRAIAIDGSDIGLYHDRALGRLCSGKNPELTVKDCSRVLNAKPREAGMYMVRAEAHRQLGDTARADADEARAEQIEPGIRERWNQPDDEDEEYEEEE